MWKPIDMLFKKSTTICLGFPQMAMFVATSAKPNRGARGPYYVQNPFEICIYIYGMIGGKIDDKE